MCVVENSERERIGEIPSPWLDELEPETISVGVGVVAAQWCFP